MDLFGSPPAGDDRSGPAPSSVEGILAESDLFERLSLLTRLVRSSVLCYFDGALENAAETLRRVAPHMPADFQLEMGSLWAELVNAYRDGGEIAAGLDAARSGLALFDGQEDYLSTQQVVVQIGLQFLAASCQASLGEWEEAGEIFRESAATAMTRLGGAPMHIELLLSRWQAIVRELRGPPEQEQIICEVGRERTQRRIALFIEENGGGAVDPEQLFDDELLNVAELGSAAQLHRLKERAMYFWQIGQSMPVAERIARYVFEEAAPPAVLEIRIELLHMYVADAIRQIGFDEGMSRAREVLDSGISLDAIRDRVHNCVYLAERAVVEDDNEKARTESETARAMASELFYDTPQLMIAVLERSAIVCQLEDDLDSATEHLFVAESFATSSADVPAVFRGTVWQQLSDLLLRRLGNYPDDFDLDRVDQMAAQAIEALPRGTGQWFNHYVQRAYRTRMEVARIREDHYLIGEFETELRDRGLEPLPLRDRG